ncbi:MAG: AAA family ATPase, partial [Candidatus Nanosynbacter sp.]|nr:AAA family ATPase [Candidatus Nanosynbacter sp.]
KIDLESKVLTDGDLQKLAITRALLTNAEILIFDEVTSHADPETIKEIVEILEDLKQDHTIIIVTHRPEMMKIADQVIVLKEGKIISKGKNKDVLSKSALYRTLRTATFVENSDDEKEFEKSDRSSDIIPLDSISNSMIK